MKKKLLWCTGIAILISLIVMGVCRYIEVRNRQTDPNWKLAEQIYKMEKALKEVDEDYACKSLSKVTPFSYTDSEGNMITYYCCQTTYLADEYGEDIGLNTDAIGSGADDYLTKPFMTKELLARLRALGRRNINTPDGTLSFGNVSLDTNTTTLPRTTNGQSVRLSEKEFRILEYMISNNTQILTREQLAVKIWGFNSESEYNNVEVYMSFTRKKLAFV